MKNFVKMLTNKEGLLKRVLISGGVFVGMALAASLTAEDDHEEFAEFEPVTTEEPKPDDLSEGTTEVIVIEEEAK